MRDFKKVFALLAAFAVLCVPALSQTAMPSTTLSAAVTNTATSIVVASATGITAPSVVNQTATILYANQEAMAVVAVSGTRITVKRGVSGTRIMAHASGDTVWVGPPGEFFNDDPVGPCTSTQEKYLPRVVLSTGNVFQCSGSPERWTLIGWGGTAGTAVTGTGSHVLASGATLTSPLITTDIRATTAGAGTVGTALKPFESIYLGTAATNNLRIDPAATAAARTAVVDDPGIASVKLPLVLRGTGTFTAAQVNAGACSAPVTVAAAGLATTSVVLAALNAAPDANTDNGLVFYAYPTAGNVNILVCNPSAGNITPAADLNFNWVAFTP